MNKTEETVLEILQDTLNQTPFTKSVNEDWKAIYHELKHQSLLPITYSWMKRQNIDVLDPQIKNAWAQAFAAQSVRWYAMIQEQKKMLDFLDSKGYKVAIIKGSSNGIYYPLPQVRGSCDIDFLVEWNRYDQICELLIAEGYTQIGEKQDSKHHIIFLKNRILFEMHKRPGGTRIDDSSEQIELIQLFQNGLKEIEHIQVCGYTIPVLPKLQNGIVQLLHIAGHMKEGVGLRHLLDWMMYVKKEVNDSFWVSELEPFAKKAELDTFAKVLTRTCQKYLGLSEEITWCKNISDSLCDQLIEYFLYQGDFGSKNKKKDQEIKVMMESNTAKGFFSRLDYSSTYSFPLSKKYKLLKPVAWVYQLCRYFRKGILQRHPIKTVLDSKKTGRERREFLKELNVYKKY